MTTTDPTDWLRRELQSDTEAIRAKSATDWLAVVIETVVALAVVVRLAVGSWVWAINHGGDATLNWSLRGPPLEAPEWSTMDSLQTAVLCAWVPAMVYYSPHDIAGPPLLVAWVGLQAAVLVVEPARVGGRVVYEVLR